MGRRVEWVDLAVAAVAFLAVMSMVSAFVPRGAFESSVGGFVLFALGLIAAVAVIDHLDKLPYWGVVLLAVAAMTYGCLLILAGASAAVEEKTSVEVVDLSLLCGDGRAGAAVVWLRIVGRGVADFPIARVALYSNGTLVGEVGNAGKMRGDGVTELSVLVPIRGVLPCEPRGNLSVVVQLGNLAVKTVAFSPARGS